MTDEKSKKPYQAQPVLVVPNPGASFEILFSKDARHIKPVKGAERARVYEILDGIGPDTILEHMASGFMLVELAVANNLPLMAMHDWLREKVDPERLIQAEKSCAEVFMVKAMLPLTVKPSSQAEAAVNTKLSEVMMRMAEKIDPARWGNKSSKSVSGDGNSIVINLRTSNEGANEQGNTNVEPDKRQAVAKQEPVGANTLLRLVGGNAGR